jgi:hypothetical protein
MLHQSFSSARIDPRDVVGDILDDRIPETNRGSNSPDLILRSVDGGIIAGVGDRIHLSPSFRGDATGSARSAAR